jgi:inositol phosphorylceramide mannosyltransferase catalytic subunit
MQNTIPARIIQTGKGRNLPLLSKAAATNLKLLHPGWEYAFFDDKDVKLFIADEFPQYEAVFNAFLYPIQRIDFFRYLAVFRLGGFYFDTDVFFATELHELLAHRCVFPFEELTLSRYLRRQYKMDWEIGNYAFGAGAAHPFLDAVIQNCIRAQQDSDWVRPMMQGIPSAFRSEFYVLNTTGPGLVSRTLAENPDMAKDVTILFPDDVCDTRTWHQFGNFGVHAQEGSWRTEGSYLRHRLANLWETWARGPLMRESVRLGHKRGVSGTTKLRATAVIGSE